jgi:hypothetical protein
LPLVQKGLFAMIDALKALAAKYRRQTNILRLFLTSQHNPMTHARMEALDACAADLDKVIARANDVSCVSSVEATVNGRGDHSERALVTPRRAEGDASPAPISQAKPNHGDKLWATAHVQDGELVGVSYNGTTFVRPFAQAKPAAVTDAQIYDEAMNRYGLVRDKHDVDIRKAFESGAKWASAPRGEPAAVTDDDERCNYCKAGDDLASVGLASPVAAEQLPSRDQIQEAIEEGWDSMEGFITYHAVEAVMALFPVAEPKGDTPPSIYDSKRCRCSLGPDSHSELCPAYVAPLVVRDEEKVDG